MVSERREYDWEESEFFFIVLRKEKPFRGHDSKSEGIISGGYLFSEAMASPL